MRSGERRDHVHVDSEHKQTRDDQFTPEGKSQQVSGDVCLSGCQVMEEKTRLCLQSHAYRYTHMTALSPSLSVSDSMPGL